MEQDYTLPISVLLRHATKAVHDIIATSSGAKALGAGLLSRDVYVQYLMMLWHLYDALERKLEAASEHPSIAPIYNPAVFNRTSSLSQDIASFLQTPDWKLHPLHASLLPLPPVLQTYVDRLNELDQTRLLAHAYVRYMGDLSGGQYIKRVVMKAYDVDHSAVAFYDFASPSRTGDIANQGEVTKLKITFRSRMDESILTEEAKRAVLDETRIAFDLNGQLLDLLPAPSASAPEPTINDKASLNPLHNSLYAAAFGLIVAPALFLIHARLTAPNVSFTTSPGLFAYVFR